MHWCKYQMLWEMKGLKWERSPFSSVTHKLVCSPLGRESDCLCASVCTSKEGKQWSVIIWKGEMRRLIHQVVFIKGYVATSEGTYSALVKGNKNNYPLSSTWQDTIFVCFCGLKMFWGFCLWGLNISAPSSPGWNLSSGSTERNHLSVCLSMCSWPDSASMPTL